MRVIALEEHAHGGDAGTQALSLSPRHRTQDSGLVLLGQMELKLLFKARACISLTQGRLNEGKSSSAHEAYKPERVRLVLSPKRSQVASSESASSRLAARRTSSPPSPPSPPKSASRNSSAHSPGPGAFRFVLGTLGRFPSGGKPTALGKGPTRRGGQEGASEAKWGMHQAIQVGQPSAGQTMLRAVAASPGKRRCCCRKRRVKNALPLLSISHKPCRSAHRQVRVCPSGAVSPSARAGAHTFARCCAQEASPCALAYPSCRSRVRGTSVISADLSE